MPKQNKTLRLPPRNDRSMGFTLSEILITLAIMGTVMAITIPTLTQRANKNTYVAGLKKTYGLLNTATNQIMMNNSNTLIYAFGTANDQIANTATMVNKYCSILECNKICLVDAVDNGCFKAQSDIKILNGQNFWDNPNEHAGFVLADGSLINVIQVATGQSCSYTDAGRTSICGWVYIDVNGFKGPNTIGRDIFSLYLNKDGLIPDGQIGTYIDDDTYCDPTSVNARDGIGCTQKVLNEQAMDY